jgi:hypothetical protein
MAMILTEEGKLTVSHAAAVDEVENDPRFPSGPWVGFFVQGLLIGKQWMELRLSFCSGVLTGEGRDIVGQFAILGHYDVADGRCSWTKTYHGKHDVFYAGFNEGKGIWGTWEIPRGPASAMRLHGGFHIWPEGMGDPSDSRLAVEAEPPVEELRPVAEPAARRRSTLLGRA